MFDAHPPEQTNCRGLPGFHLPLFWLVKAPDVDVQYSKVLLDPHITIRGITIFSS